MLASSSRASPELSSPSRRAIHSAASSGSTAPQTERLFKGSSSNSNSYDNSVVNPLFSLGQSIESKDHEPVHVWSVSSNGDVIIRSGTPPAKLFHFRSSPPSSIRKGKSRERSRERDRVVEQDGDHQVRVKDKGTTSSLGDEMRFAMHERIQDLKEKVHHSGASTPSVATPEVQSQLGSVAERGEAEATTGHPTPSNYSADSSSPTATTPPTTVASLALSCPSSDTPPPPLPSPPVSPRSPRPPPPHRIKTSPPLRSSPNLSQPPSSPGRRISRTQSYHVPPLRTSTGSAQDAFDPTDDPDDVSFSIAAQADLIRRNRRAKELDEIGELPPPVASGSGSSAHPHHGHGQPGSAQAVGGGAPITPTTKRRSTRMGSMGDQALVGKVIGLDHSAYVLMYNMLTGIRIGVSRCQAKLKRPLTDEDYTARHKFSFDIVGNELTPSTKYDFKFKDYAPWVFRELREYFYLDPSDYLVSLTAKYILSELGSPGKSGSFFYFSRDYRFIIKTIRHSEHKFLRSILKEYHEYVKSNPHTLLSRFYGLHRVKLPRGKKIHFVIMNNLFPPHRDIHEKYDLKGSSVGRVTPESKIHPGSILKDLNWLQRSRTLALGPEKKALFEEQLRRDTQLMQKLGIMDYSLLTGIHNVERGNQDGLRDGMLSVFQPDPVKVRRRKATHVMRDEDLKAVRNAIQRSDPKALDEANKLPEQDTSERRLFLFYQDEGGIRATGEANEPLDAIYYLGIIDILTPYTLVKKLEHFFRSLKYDKHQISAVPPKEYGDRFMNFVYSVIKGNDTSKRPKMWSPPPEKPPSPSSTVVAAAEKTAEPGTMMVEKEKVD